ncbi:Thylakoid-anchored PsbP-like protein [Cymbomonas tetramitiformis]|uniref:Thylakoid-anchored PsbP-like protein n=1 Tax=Cymbomonas tetramitiformis TaxID=36881 RepID=A0AAE0EMP5_9CHLO|nr:Thylakoid-anchored PsbP-like protein [Cymbomonas tetramitiformis]
MRSTYSFGGAKIHSPAGSPRSKCRYSSRVKPPSGPRTSLRLRASVKDDESLLGSSDPIREPADMKGSESSAKLPNLADPVETIYWGGELPSRRRLLVGASTATALALGGNFLGITSSLLGINPELAGDLQLDVVVPVKGLKRCVDASNAYEYLYPAEWLVDQRLVLRAARRAELERPLDPLSAGQEARKARMRSVTEPVTGYGPAAGSGEENVSLIVAPIQRGFSMDQLGTPEEAGTTLLSTTIAPPGSGKEANLIEARSRTMDGYLYYILEYTVASRAWARHNFAVFVARDDTLYTFNAQASQACCFKIKGRSLLTSASEECNSENLRA